MTNSGLAAWTIGYRRAQRSIETLAVHDDIYSGVVSTIVAGNGFNFGGSRCDLRRKSTTVTVTSGALTRWRIALSESESGKPRSNLTVLRERAHIAALYIQLETCA